MDRCSYCGEENSYFFVCPRCKEKFCKLHKSPQSHKCEELEAVQPSQPLDTDSALLDKTSDPISEHLTITSKEQDKVTINKTSRFIEKYSLMNVSYIIGGLLIGLIFTNILYALYNPLQDDYDLVKGNYFSLKSNYTVLLDKQYKMVDNISRIESINERINIELNILGLNNSRLKSQILERDEVLNALNVDYVELEYLYNCLLANYTETLNSSKYWSSIVDNNITQTRIPSINQIGFWLYQDDVERLYQSKDFKPIHAALIRSMRAKAYGWPMGIIEVYANFTEAEKYTYNYIGLLEGYAYIDAKSDMIFLSENQLTESSEVISFGDNKYRIYKIKILLGIT